MHNLRDLYHQLIIDHSRNPRYFGRLDSYSYSYEGYNPLCGDQLTVFFQEKNGTLTETRFEGSGCAISIASASLMMETLKGKSIEKAEILFSQFYKLVTGIKQEVNQLGKLEVLMGVAEFPARVKCATLCWHTALAALHNHNETIMK